MDCQDTMKFEINKCKRIGQVLFIVEGLKTEPNLIYQIFCRIFGYQMDRLYRNGEYRVFHRTDDPFSKITVINTEESNIGFISKDNEFLNRMFETLIEDYQLDIDNAAIYYLFDRDPASNTDKTFIEDMLSKLASARDINEDMERQGLLLLSYPCIESFVGMNLLSNSIDYCWRKTVSIGDDLKKSLQQDGLIPNKISEQTLIHCADELISSLSLIGVETTRDAFQASMDHFADTNICVYEWQEQQYGIRNQYGLLSLFIMALIDLGLINIVQDE